MIFRRRRPSIGMKYYPCPVSQAMRIKPYPQDCDVLPGCKRSAAPRSVRSVHFPNDVVFQDYVKHGELERIGRFIRARRVSLDTIYLSGEGNDLPPRGGDAPLIENLLRDDNDDVDDFLRPCVGMAAIHEAVLSGNLECVKLLVHHGADIHQRDEEGWTPLHMACSDGFPDIAR